MSLDDIVSYQVVRVIVFVLDGEIVEQAVVDNHTMLYTIYFLNLEITVGNQMGEEAVVGDGGILHGPVSFKLQVLDLDGKHIVGRYFGQSCGFFRHQGLITEHEIYHGCPYLL